MGNALIGQVRSWLPRGSLLSDEEWERRHRAIVLLLFAHVPAIAFFGLSQGLPLGHILIEAGVVALAGLAATVNTSRKWRSTAATLGLLTTSALLVHISGGMIEAHFHFFVMVGVLTLYQDWLPFLLAIAYTVLHHGILGVVDPTGVFNHPGAWRSPWRWAIIHGLFVLAASVAYIVAWRVNEKARMEAARSYQELRNSKERFRSLVQNALDAIAVINTEGTMTYQSPSAEAVLGYPPDQLVGHNGFDLVHPDDVERAKGVLADIADKPGAFAVLEVRAKHADGTWRWIEARHTNLLDDPNIGGIVINYRDISERKQLETDLTRQAFHDSLTNLPNRLYFMDRLERALARVKRTGEVAAVMFCDLDSFKAINDSLGHEAGDSVLVEVARRLHRAVRAVDTAARLGGDEFAILLEDVRLDALDDVVERICADVAKPIPHNGSTVKVGVSVGVTISETGRETASDLLRNADMAMYVAKSEGKGRSARFDPEMLTESMVKLQLKDELRQAIEQNDVTLHYQPIVELQSGKVAGVEALARWFHPGIGLISPAEFIPLAEESGLIVSMGARLLNLACMKTRSLQETYPDLSEMWVSFNVSGRELREPDFVDVVTDALDRSGLDPGCLVLEVTESLLMEQVEIAAVQLEAVASRGVRVAIDDFGTGQSSLSWLGRLPAGILKIDRTFVRNLDRAATEQTLTRMMVKLADSLRMDVVAEGIERPEQEVELKGLRCRWGQGFLYTRPLGEKDLRRFLAQTHGPPELEIRSIPLDDHALAEAVE